MTRQTNYKDEWLERAFRLAFFLHGRREVAKRIAKAALGKLEVASNAQFKRLYYTPTGRADHRQATRSRVSLGDLQLLQRLVLVESEIYEREAEAAGRATETSLVKFFIKHLVRISLKRNSFYVTLAVARILHNYATSNAMDIYNVVVQDPERVHDDYYYRSRKGVLMKELKERFGELVEIVKAGRGEERFAARAGETGAFAEIARESLAVFTPWNSRCTLPEKFDPTADVLESFYFDRRHPDEEHQTEVNRIHAALHPHCFDRLTSALRLPPSLEKMEIPKFMLTIENRNDDHHDWRNPPSLEEDEYTEIKAFLEAQAASRKAASVGFLRVVADGGAELARIDLLERDAAAFSIAASAELIEVYAGDGARETLLAAHLLSFDELQAGARKTVVTLEGGQQITFDLTPVLDEYGEVAEINGGVRYEETVRRRRFAWSLRRAKFRAGRLFAQPLLKPAMALALVLLAVMFGWLVFRRADGDNNLAVQPTPSARPGSANTSAPPAPKKDDLAVNADPTPTRELKPRRELPLKEAVPQTARKTPPVEKPKLTPEKAPLERQPRDETANLPRRRSETDENGVLRLPVRDSSRTPFNERSNRSEVRGNPKKFIEKSLREIRYIVLEISGDELLGREIADRIARELGASSGLVVTADQEKADAALKIFIRHESDGETREDATVAAIVRLVNAKGFVVYPAARGVSAWKYVGTLANLPARIARDLSAAKK